MKEKRKQTPPNLAMRLSKADKEALRKVAARLETSQTEAVRRLVRECLKRFAK